MSDCEIVVLCCFLSSTCVYLYNTEAVMNLDFNQVIAQLARIDPGLTKEFLLSALIPLVACSGGLVNALGPFENGFTISKGFLPIYNVVSVWRGGGTLSGPVLLYNGVISLHGIVLASYVWQRRKNAQFVTSFNKFVINERDMLKQLRDGKMFVRIFSWLLMSGQMSLWNTIPYLYTLRGDGSSRSSIIGLSLISVGSVMQAVADYQKKKHKEKEGPDSFCSSGLYQLCRHPNYLGEILLQLGVLVSGYSLFPTIPRWLLVGACPLMLISMMFVITADRADIQANKYASNTQFADYQRRVKKLIPFIW